MFLKHIQAILILLLTFSGRAEGAIIYTPGNIGIFNTLTRSVILDIDENGTDDVVFAAGNPTNEGFSMNGSFLGRSNRIISNSIAVTRLEAGQNIGADLTDLPVIGEWRADVALIRACGNTPGGLMCFGGFLGDSLELEQRGFIGVEFRIDAGTHYAWFDVGAHELGIGGIIYGYAYETEPGRSIAAGAIPEPGTAALLALAGGIVLMKRRSPKFRD